MDNPEEHITGRLGLTQLRGALEPLGWTLAETVDYGIDIQVEVFREHKTTGITFGLQSKSSRSTDYSSAGDFIAQTLKVKNARYLIQEMQIPTILVHANVESGRTYWTAPQLDGEVAQRLVGRSDDATLTLRIPTENSLPESADLLLEAVGRAQVVLATRASTSTPPVDFVSALRNLTDTDRTIRELQRPDAPKHVNRYNGRRPAAFSHTQTDDPSSRGRLHDTSAQ